jgi:hypothetical protein
MCNVFRFKISAIFHTVFSLTFRFSLSFYQILISISLILLLNPDFWAIFSFPLTLIWPLRHHPFSFPCHLFLPTLGTGSATCFMFSIFHFINSSLRRTVSPSFLSRTKNFLSICLCKSLQPFVGPWPLFSYLNLYSVGWTSWTRGQPFTTPLPIHRTTQTE